MLGGFPQSYLQRRDRLWPSLVLSLLPGISLFLSFSGTTSDLKARKCLDVFLMHLDAVYAVDRLVQESELQFGNVDCAAQGSHFVDKRISTPLSHLFWRSA